MKDVGPGTKSAAALLQMDEQTEGHNTEKKHYTQAHTKTKIL